MASSGSVSHTRVLVGLVAGSALGSTLNFLVNEGGLAGAKPAVAWVVKYVAGPVGAVFLNLLFLAIIPLVFASLAVGVTRLGGTENVGRVGAKTLAYFLVTTACAAVIGLTAVNMIQPGRRLPAEQRERLVAEYHKGNDAAAAADKKPGFGIDTFVNIVPRNLFKAVVEKDMLAIIFTAILVGLALARIDPEKAALVTAFLGASTRLPTTSSAWRWRWPPTPSSR